MKFCKLFIYGISFLLLSCNKTNKDSNPNEVSPIEDVSSTNPNDEEDWEKDFAPYEMDKSLSADEKMQIAVLKKEMGFKMKAIGMDTKLSGYQKGVEKRKLKSQYLNEINNILQGKKSNLVSTATQNPQLAQQYQKIHEIELQIKKLEYDYELQKDKLEMEENNLPENVYKQKKDELKLNYKRQKDLLKLKKDSIVLLNMSK